LQQQVSYLL